MRFLRQFHRTSRLAQRIAGECIEEQHIITQQQVEDFTEIIGDENPIHKKQSGFDQPIVPGALLNAIVSGIIGSKFPGAGTVVLSQQFKFPNKCHPDEKIDVRIEMLQDRKIMKVGYEIIQDEKIVFEGTADLLRPSRAD